MDRNYLSTAIFENSAFLDAYAKGMFWHGKLDKSILKRAFSWTHLNHALSTNRITNDRFRLSFKNGHAAPNKQAFQPAKDGFGRLTDHLLINELHSVMQDGATGVFEAVHEIFPVIEALIDALATNYYARSSANAYISFGITSGFGVHSDDHDVLVFQIEGRKQWSFFGSPKKKFKAMVTDIASPTEENVTEKMILSEGDMLFIPKGTWHDVEATGEPSLHLNVSLVYPSYFEYMEWLLGKNRLGVPYQDIKLKNDINLLEVSTHCKSFFDVANSEASVANFLKAYYSKYPSIRNQPSFPSLNIACFNDKFQKIPFSFIDIFNEREPGDSHTIVTLGKKYTLNSQEYTLLSGMEVGRCYSGKCLLESFSRIFTSWSSIAPPMQILLKEGLVRKVLGTPEQ